jgi:hypothetical protein
VKNYFSQLLNVHGFRDVRQIDVHTAELLISGPSRLEVEIAVAKLKKYKSPGSDEILAELIRAGDEILRSESRKLICGKKVLLWQFTRGAIKLTVVIIMECNCYMLMM